jgi:hypothetical protein
MPWFAAHAILHHELVDGLPQDRFSVYENVYLIKAEDRRQAQDEATRIAMEEESDCSGTLTVDGRPARLVFDGIRQIVSVLHATGSHSLASGDEVTYSEFEVTDRDHVRRLVEGGDVPVLCLGVNRFKS